MGTFHDDKGDLHGITVVVETADEVFVGRCDTMDEQGVVLLDCDRHREGEDDVSNADWLQRAARFGVWAKHDRLVLPAAEVTAVTALGDYVRHGRDAARSVPSEAAQPETPAPAAAQPEAPVLLTDSARDEVRRLLATEENAGRSLRLGVAGGGCSGLVYKVEFDRANDDDTVVPQDGFDVVLDRKSLIYLRGVTLDHQGGLVGRGFVFQNPNASNTCGCGESFAV